MREKAIQEEEKEKKKMERTPRPEMGREWGRRRSVTGVSTPPFLQVLQMQFCPSLVTKNIYLLQRTISHCVMLSVCICMFLSET